MRKKEKTRLLQATLSVLIVLLVVQTALLWLFPEVDTSDSSNSGTVRLFVPHEPIVTPPSTGHVTVRVVEAGS